jgi:hypothetical protein
MTRQGVRISSASKFADQFVLNRRPTTWEGRRNIRTFRSILKHSGLPQEIPAIGVPSSIRQMPPSSDDILNPGITNAVPEWHKTCQPFGCFLLSSSIVDNVIALRQGIYHRPNA